MTHIKKNLEEAHKMSFGDDGLSHTYLCDSSTFGNGGLITSTVNHHVDCMMEPFFETDRDGNVTFAVVPPCIARHTLDSGEVDYNHILLCVYEARRLSSAKNDDSSGNCFNFGCTSSTENETGAFLCRYDKSHTEKNGSVKNVLPRCKIEGFDARAMELLSKIACKLERLHLDYVMTSHAWETLYKFPSLLDVWVAAKKVSEKSGDFRISAPTFRGCHSFPCATAGVGNKSKVHRDLKNTTIQMGGLCDGHISMMDSSHVVLVVHVQQEDGNIKAHVVSQHFLATTYFQANESSHIACDTWTWLKLMGKHQLPTETYTYIETKVLEYSEMYKCTQSERVWIAVHGRASMFDLKWELRNYKEANEDPEIYAIVSGLGVGQVEANRRR
jgi:hypothetical protein